MERIVNVYRNRKSGAVVALPMGTFKGYGAHVGIYPNREITEPAPDLVGSVVVELLKASGPTGYHIKNIEAYRDSVVDAETTRVRKVYKIFGGTTGAIAKSFSMVGISLKDGQKSWGVQMYRYDTRKRLFVAYGTKQRVKVSLGESSLGDATLEALRRC